MQKWLGLPNKYGLFEETATTMHLQKKLHIKYLIGVLLMHIHCDTTN